MRIPAALITLLVGLALGLTGLWVSQSINMLPVAASLNAPVYDDLFRVLFSIGTILFLGVTGLLLFSLIRFRRRPHDLGDGLAIEGNLPLEILWTAIPAVVVLFVGLYSYDIYERMGGMTPLQHMGHDHSAMAQVAMASTGEASAPTVGTPEDGLAPPERVWGGIGFSHDPGAVVPVEVTAMQFAFIFHYPEADITSGELHIPADQPVALNLTAKDVIHAFWVPQFRLKQDVIPGQPTVLTFTATRPGRYPIVCAELCGPYHGGMRSTVVVHDPDDFQAWIDQNQPHPAPATQA